MALPDLTAILPDESLAHIFVCAQNTDPIREPDIKIELPESYKRYYGSRDDTTPRTSRLGWLQATFVCARWRRVAIDEGRLWAKPSFLLGTLWLHEFVRRSKRALLDISYHTARPNRVTDRVPDHSELIKLILAQHGRLQHLQVAVHSNNLKLVNAVLGSDLPLLETFNFFIGDFDFPGGWEDALARLSANALRLRYLRLAVQGISFASLDWRVSTLPALRRLHIQCGAQLPNVSVPSLLGALQCMPVLSALLLTGSVEQQIPFNCGETCTLPNGDVIVVNLRHLEELQIENALESYTHLLHHITIPGSAHISIKDVHTHSLDDAQVMCAYLNECMLPHLNQQPSFLSATIAFTAGYFNDFGPGPVLSLPDQIALWLRRPMDTKPVHPHAHWLSRRSVRPEELRLTLLLNIFPALTPTIDFRGITTLTLDGHTEISDPWPIFLALESVETLHLASQSNTFSRSAGLLEALAVSEGRLPFPKLRYLNLMRYFMPDIICDLPHHYPRRPRTCLEDVIYERRALEAALQTVEVPMLETIRKIEAGEWKDPDLDSIRETIARLEALPEVHIVQEHSHGIGLEP